MQKYYSFIAFLYLTGCSWVMPILNLEPKPELDLDIVIEPVEPTTPVPEVKPELPKVDPLEQRQNRLNVLLAQAEIAFEKDHLMQPSYGSAYSRYQEVLAIDESNIEAHTGMEKITSRYMKLAKSAFLNNRPARGELMLKRALNVAATKQATDQLRRKYKKQQIIGKNEFRLSRANLSARNSESIAELDSLAKKAQLEKSRLLIIARNDAEGRWIYQQMRSAVEGHRLRGNIKIGRIPKIVLIDMDA